MWKRSKAREYALQLLYQIDITNDAPSQAVDAFWKRHEAPSEIKTFANRLVDGTTAHLAEIDRLIMTYTDNWELKRMAVVDRNILRLGTFELLFLEEVPPKVCLNEAVELAKRFGNAESSKFVNGILDKIHKMCGRSAAGPATPPPDAGGSSDPPATRASHPA